MKDKVVLERGKRGMGAEALFYALHDIGLMVYRTNNRVTRMAKFLPYSSAFNDFEITYELLGDGLALGRAMDFH